MRQTLRNGITKTFSLCSTAIVIAGLALSGCGGGGGSSSGGGGGTPPSNNSGTQNAGSTIPGQALNSVISGNAGSGDLPSQASVATVQTAYAAALAANPNDAPTNAGYAISTAALAAANIQSVSGNQFTAGVLVSGGQTSLSKVTNMLCVWNVPHILNSGGAPKLTPLDILPNIAPASFVGHATTTATQAQATLAAADVLLQGVEKSIDFILNNTSASFVFVIDNPAPGAGTGNVTVQLGKPEFEALRAAVSTARAVINASIAYNVNVGSFTYGPVSTQFASVYTAGGTLTPSQYLPPSPFATLNTGGATDIKTVSTELQATATSAEAVITGVEARNNNGFLLNPGNLVTNTQLNKYLTDIQTYAPYLTTEESINLYGSYGTNANATLLNLPAFFNNPPADLKAWAPNITVSAPNGTGTIAWTAPAANYPGLVNGCPSFGGLFPNGDNSPKFTGIEPVSVYDSYAGDQTNAGAVIAATILGNGAASL